MATLLQFDPTRRSQALRGGAHNGPAGPAKILFFTGIRYERQPETPTGKPANGKHRKPSSRNTRRKVAVNSKR